MNIRLIIIIFLIIVFAAGTGAESYSQLSGVPLTKAYNGGHVVIIQITNAGTVPHQVLVNNTGIKPVKLSMGDVLNSNTSQNLVVAENVTVNANSSSDVDAYCLEPAKQAVPGATFNSVGTASNAIKEIIYSSNPNNLQNATSTQLQIWLLSSGTKFSIYTGEPVALIDEQGTSYTTLRKGIKYAKTLISLRFNITTDQINSYNQNSTSDNGNLWNNIVNSFKS